MFAASGSEQVAIAGARTTPGAAAALVVPKNSAIFNSGHVDAWDIWSRYIEQVTEQDNARILVNGDGYGSPYSFEVASRAALNDPAKAAAIKDYLTILNQAYVWSATHTAAWAKLWGGATGLPSSVMVRAAKRRREQAGLDHQRCYLRRTAAGDRLLQRPG